MEVDSPDSPADGVPEVPAPINEMEEDESPGFIDLEADIMLEDNSKGKSSYDSMSVDSPTDHSEKLGTSPEVLEKFFKDASRAFFNEWGLVSHQIDSFNDFVNHGLQELFDSLGEVKVEPDYNPQDARPDGAWKHATISFGKVRLEKPKFWVERIDIEEDWLKLTPKHARLQNMTYSSQIKVMVRVQVYLHGGSDKAKTGKDAGVHKKVEDDKESEIVLGRLPVMVRSDLCWLHSQDKNDCFYDPGGYFLIKGMEKVRSPRLGDKFSSMHGQKGVIGLLEHQENFPFTLQGIVPDIVINPHAFPTRQTPGQLLEAALGKGIACGGSAIYATPFSTPSVDVIYDQLQRSGFCRWGSEKVINGRTGEFLQSMIFMGPTFYQRLIHMAEDKVKYRNTGPVHPLTRQPVADRKRFGGVKFGEMERDCLLAHGAAANLYERMFTLSDFSQMHICQSCKRSANVIQRPVLGGRKIRGPYCVFCKSAENIVRINVPYGAKLLYQELFSMGICLKFDTTEV